MTAMTLIERTARQMYREDPAVRGERVDWASLSPEQQLRYNKMARAAVTIILREPVELTT